MTEDEIGQLLLEYRKIRNVYVVLDSKIAYMGKILDVIHKKLCPESHLERLPINEDDEKNISMLPSHAEILSAMEEWKTARNALAEIWKKIPQDERLHTSGLPKNTGYLKRNH